MTPPTERVTMKERKWLEQIAKEHLPAEYLSENGGVMAALAEVCGKTKDACAAKYDAEIEHICQMILCAGNPTVVTAADPSKPELGNVEVPLAELVQMTFKGSIRNLEITGE